MTPGLSYGRNGVRRCLLTCAEPKQGTGVAALHYSGLAAVRPWCRRHGALMCGVPTIGTVYELRQPVQKVEGVTVVLT